MNHETKIFDILFKIEELNSGIQIMKKGKTAGVDDVLMEQINTLDPELESGS